MVRDTSLTRAEGDTNLRRGLGWADRLALPTSLAVVGIDGGSMAAMADLSMRRNRGRPHLEVVLACCA